MAIFIASTKSISRGKGQSAVASASYRAGVELEDKRYGKKHDYSKRHGVMSADIILPSSLASQGITIERNDLWNLAEETETRKNSRVAREWLVNLPHELDEKTRKQLAHDFSQQLADKFGVIADCAIHQPTQKEVERGADARNFHAHIMLTTRQADLDKDGKIILGDKSVCELSDTDRAKRGLSKAKDEVTEIRQLWERLANEKLAEHNHQLIDSRSYKSQGIDLLPQVKMGKDATHLERDGVQTWKGDINRAITERNEIVFSRELIENKRINDRADQIIIESRRERTKEQTPPPPQKAFDDGSSLELHPTPKPKPAKENDAVAKAMALAKQIKSKRDAEKVQEAKERAEQVRRQREALERLREQERQKEMERQRLEQERLAQLEQEQAQEFITDLHQMASGAVEAIEQVMADNGMNKDKPAGKALLAVLAGKLVIDQLNTYMDDPSHTDKQKQLAEGKRNDMMEQTLVNAERALEAIKDLYHTDDRNQHLKPLKHALSGLKTASDEQQQQLETVERRVNDFSDSLDRNYGYGLGW